MDFTSKKMVYEIPGEPAIVVNGLPPVPPNGENLGLCSAIIDTDTELCRNEGFGQWLEGREVRKLFGNQFYAGKVAKYDNKMHWYKVVYEDGDSEDLEWNELKQILLPLDINIPLKMLAMNIINRKHLDMMNIPLTTQPRTITKTTQKPLQQTAKAEVQARNDCWRSGGKDQRNGAD
ncbi:unnamed protein product [Cuscuta campestris]|uniref:PTM/DIR17-like Tudor domain-containing protein n=1 Tax=Cuscuta campestris TaxID=132261 RepID=A0A484KA28_9ASTE|nr:unnamed protein product [Cuscuta campestris]